MSTHTPDTLASGENIPYGAGPAAFQPSSPEEQAEFYAFLGRQEADLQIEKDTVLPQLRYRMEALYDRQTITDRSTSIRIMLSPMPKRNLKCARSWLSMARWPMPHLCSDSYSNG
jgi:hypothetical protein